MFDDLPPCVEPEDVDARIVLVTGPALVAMKDDVVPLGQGPDELDMFAGVSAAIASK